MPLYLCRRKSTYARQWLQLLPLRGINNICMYVYVCMYVCMYTMYVCYRERSDSTTCSDHYVHSM